MDGIDESTVSRWLAAQVRGCDLPVSFALIAGGHSNLTFRIVDASGRSYVLRRPPLAEVLSSAHDMTREHTVISALGQTSVPVPQVFASCDDLTVTGAPFYVMSFVEGAVYADHGGLSAALPLESTVRASRDLVEVLATLHAVDPQSVGLGGFARPDGYVERQLRTWLRQYSATADPWASGVGPLHDRLAARVPAQQRSSVTHGDYRLGNTMISGDGTVAAILDWELATLGDPLADLGWLLVTWRRAADDVQSAGQDLDLSTGFLDEESVAGHYAELTGLDLCDLEFYLAFNYWRWACIMQGVHHRYLAGAMGEAASAGLPDFSSMLGWQLAQSRAHLDSHEARGTTR
jgi:aminoglycoside phosphotransferase (APT) family kinase protein